MNTSIDTAKKLLHQGIAIPANPLALTANRKLDERRQRALCRYYIASGSGGLAVGVHTTQFQIRDPKVGLFQPVLQIAKEEMDNADVDLFRVAGICGNTQQAVSEATLLKDLGYHAGLLSLAAMSSASEDELINHCKAVADVIPVIGFYLQPAVGGRVLPFSFWRRFAEIPNVIAIKMAPFNRYQTYDVIRAVAEAGRDDIALYTGNDDHIILDLITPYRFNIHGVTKEYRFKGGLLGHWSVWTKRAVEQLQLCKSFATNSNPIPQDILKLSNDVTDANAAFFDTANAFKGCIAGLHEVLRRQGLLEGIWCLDPNETLSPGQLQEIDRVYRTYPELNDDQFIAENLDAWLR